jgi:hypothetical protein
MTVSQGKTEGLLHIGCYAGFRFLIYEGVVGRLRTWTHQEKGKVVATEVVLLYRKSWTRYSDVTSL